MKPHPKPPSPIEEVAQFLKQETFDFPPGCTPNAAHHHGDAYTSIRTSEHQGKTIEIHTTYKILIDGKPMQTGAMALNDGKVHSHDLPQYAFSSAIDMAKSLIDLSNKTLPEDELMSLYGDDTNEDSTHHHDTHSDHHSGGHH